ncbi:MAG: hypothetical protein RDV48_15870 [Candidatus Eremiobacteraeota bacterium]|nr:hypothetical protein [Candidatus Eremiobacteraeota bacterium]
MVDRLGGLPGSAGAVRALKALPAPPCKAGEDKEALSEDGTAGQDSYVPVRIRHHDQSVEEPHVAAIPRKRIESILNNERFLVSDGESVGFTAEERRAILESSIPPFNAKLNVCLHAESAVSLYEGLLGRHLPWPTGFFTHYLGETQQARELMTASPEDQEKATRYEQFISDLSRSNEAYRQDGTRVFINIAPAGHPAMPTFNAARLEISMAPYPYRQNIIEMERPFEDRDSVAHETGHLVNAALRPGWDEAKYSFDSDFEVCALREVFGDLTALFTALGDIETCREVLDETGGDVTRSNRASRISERGGDSLYFRYFDGTGTPRNERYLRNLANDFRYVPHGEAEPFSIGTAPVGSLYDDVYSFSQVFSGAVYDLMTALYLNSGGGAEALKKSALKAAELFSRAVEISPWWKPDFSTLAECMLEADMMDSGGKNLALMKEVFQKRSLLTDERIARAGQSLRELPSLNIKEISQAPRDAAKILASQGMLPGDEGLEVTQLFRHSNAVGETFIACSFEKPFKGAVDETPLDLSTAILSDICDLTPDIRERGSLILKFDKEGKLVYRRSEGYHKADMAQHYLKIARHTPDTSPGGTS